MMFDPRAQASQMKSPVRAMMPRMISFVVTIRPRLDDLVLPRQRMFVHVSHAQLAASVLTTDGPAVQVCQNIMTATAMMPTVISRACTSGPPGKVSLHENAPGGAREMGLHDRWPTERPCDTADRVGGAR